MRSHAQRGISNAAPKAAIDRRDEQRNLRQDLACGAARSTGDFATAGRPPRQRCRRRHRRRGRARRRETRRGRSIHRADIQRGTATRAIERVDARRHRRAEDDPRDHGRADAVVVAVECPDRERDARAEEQLHRHLGERVAAEERLRERHRDGDRRSGRSPRLHPPSGQHEQRQQRDAADECGEGLGKAVPTDPVGGAEQRRVEVHELGLQLGGRRRVVGIARREEAEWTSPRLHRRGGIDGVGPRERAHRRVDRELALLGEPLSGDEVDARIAIGEDVLGLRPTVHRRHRSHDDDGDRDRRDRAGARLRGSTRAPGRRKTPSTHSSPAFRLTAITSTTENADTTARASAASPKPAMNAAAERTASSNQRGTTAPSARVMTGPYGTGRCRTGSCT